MLTAESGSIWCFARGAQTGAERARASLRKAVLLITACRASRDVGDSQHRFPESFTHRAAVFSGSASAALHFWNWETSAHKIGWKPRRPRSIAFGVSSLRRTIKFCLFEIGLPPVQVMPSDSARVRKPRFELTNSTSNAMPIPYPSA